MQRIPKGYLVEAILFTSYVHFGINWIMGTMFTREIMDFFGLDGYSQATMISNAITVAKIIGNLAAAWILIKLKPKWAVTLAMFCMVAGTTLSTFATDFSTFVAMRFILGFGAALQVVYFAAFVVHYFPKERRPAMNSLNGCAYTLGSIITMIIFEPMLQWLKYWQNVVFFFGSVSGILLCCWLVVGENFQLYTSNDSNNSKEKPYTFLIGLKDPINYILPFTYSGSLLLYLTTLTLFPLYKGAAYTPRILAILISVFAMLGAVIGVRLLRITPTRMLLLRGSGIGMLCFGTLLIYTSNSAVAIMSAMGLGIVLFTANAVLLSLPQELPGATPAKVTFIMGFYWSFAYILETLYYYGIGIIIDGFGFKAGMYMAVALSVTCLIGSFLLPETKKRSE